MNNEIQKTAEENWPDGSRERANFLARELASYGIDGAGADETPEQKWWGAICVESAIRIMEADMLTDIKADNGNTIYTIPQLVGEWKRLRREAKNLSK